MAKCEYKRQHIPAGTDQIGSAEEREHGWRVHTIIQNPNSTKSILWEHEIPPVAPART